jgi:hypothetical protein
MLISSICFYWNAHLFYSYEEFKSTQSMDVNNKEKKSYKQVYTFCMNKYKQNEKELQNTLMLFNVC